MPQIAASRPQSTMKAALTGKYEADNLNDRVSATLSLAANVGDATLHASLAQTLDVACHPDVAGHPDSSLPLLSFSLEKPKSFSIRYSPELNAKEDALPDVKLEFKNLMEIAKTKVKLKCRHAVRERETTLDGSVKLNAGITAGVVYAVGDKACTVKCKYVHSQRQKTVVEPSFDFAARAWAVAVSRTVGDGDTLRASYEASSEEKTLGLQWSTKSKANGHFQISASINTTDLKPKFMAESTWNFLG